ncbi:hypothetical protein U1Q18_009374, partial [Sarracenia purpurea var. burkii]
RWRRKASPNNHRCQHPTGKEGGGGGFQTLIPIETPISVSNPQHNSDDLRASRLLLHPNQRVSSPHQWRLTPPVIALSSMVPLCSDHPGVALTSAQTPTTTSNDTSAIHASPSLHRTLEFQTVAHRSFVPR